MRKASQQDGQIDWFVNKMKEFPTGKPDGWVTINEIAKLSGDSRKTVSDRLKNMIKAGEIEESKCIIDGHLCNIYKRK